MDAVERRDAGFSWTLDGCPQEWKARFIARLIIRSRQCRHFTSEDITKLVGLPFPEGSSRNNVVGALMNGCCQRGWIRRVGFRKAKRLNQHATTIMTWCGA